ncbi:MAG: hypothetical protein WBM50_27995, partial [Acidimicrobiales bacterium]
TPTGPAAAARTKLNEVTSKAPPSPRSKRRDRTDEATPAKTSTEAPTPSSPTETAAESSTAAPAPAPAPKAASDQHADTTGDQPADSTGEAPAPAAGPGALTLASVSDAFAEELDGVRQKVRVRFKGGRVLSVEGTTVVFGVPTAIHRDRCAEVKDEIEQAFSAHFGQRVTLEVVVDDTAPPPTMDPAKIESKPVREITPDDEVGPVEELADATDQSANGLERLTKAFPGSTVVEPQPE